MLKLTNIHKQYTSPDEAETPEILSGIDLEVKQGKSIAIVGPSGSGKSTLLNIIGTLDTPSIGQIFLDGNDLSNLNIKKLAEIRNQKIGFIFQMHHLLPQLTVIENVLIPTIAGNKKINPEKSDERAKKLLERVDLSHRINYRPGQLSGGECQRVAVVRALINKPKLLLADEPTGSLDSKSADNLSTLLLKLNKEENVALIMVTHSMKLANQMGKIYEIKSGKLELIE